ncbi:MAG: hypothetical protein R2713_11265 [Ilumatobacteraceae bacterium]
MVGDLAHHLAGEHLERQFDPVTIEGRHPVEQTSEVADRAELDRAGGQVVGGDDAQCQQTIGQLGVTLAVA